MTDIRARESSRTTLGTAVTRLTGAGVLNVALALVTSPILARALGPAGRGEVAAIFAVLGIAPWVSELGITAFLSREQARGSRSLGVLLGSTTPIVLAASVIGPALAIPLAHLLGRGRPAVVDFIEIGLFLLPISAWAQMLSGIAAGDQRWWLLIIPKALAAVGTTVAVVTLSLLGALTVTTVAITYLVAGSLANVPLLVVLRGSRPWHFTPPVARLGIAFGVRSWLSTVANTGNAYLDQILMAGLVSSRQLGLYALAVTLSTGSGSLIAATAGAIFPRVAMGDSPLAGRACRVTLAIVGVPSVVAAATSTVIVPVVWGQSFAGAVPMIIVLLAAGMFVVPGQVLGSALIAAGRPSATAHGQIAGLVITVPALIFVLPVAGGIGAAWVSLGSYAVTFAIIVRAAKLEFSLPYRSLLVVTPDDLRWLWNRLRRRGPAPQPSNVDLPGSS